MKEDGTEETNRTEKSARKKAVEKFSSLFGLSAAFGGCMIEMRGRNTLTVGGCRRILTYSKEEISLLTKDGVLSVTGRDLTCISYFATDVGIEGDIAALRFSDSTCEEEETV